MTTHFYRPKEFAQVVQQLEEAGLTIEEAKYFNRAFGSWDIEVSNAVGDRGLLIWDGRDRWIILQTQDDQGTWVDDRIVRDPQDDTIQQIIDRLNS